MISARRRARTQGTRPAAEFDDASPCEVFDRVSGPVERSIAGGRAVIAKPSAALSVANDSSPTWRK